MKRKRYTLENYAALLADNDLLIEKDLKDAKQTAVHYLAYQASDVQPGSLFFCKSLNFKKEYLIEAIHRGAIGYVSDTKYDVGELIPHFLVSDIHHSMARIADAFYHSPQQNLTIIGVGGTKGKTTTVYYIKAILDAYLKDIGEKPTGLITTISVFDGLNEQTAVNTTPVALDLQRHLANAVEAGLKFMVMEVSSQALKYQRTAGLAFAVGVFLNIDEDHISPNEHTDFEDYFQSKVKMFSQTKSLLVYHETNERERVLEYAKLAKEVKTYSIQSADVDYFATDIVSQDTGSTFHVQSKMIDETYELSMIGSFNVENALAAIATADLLGIPSKYAQAALRNVTVPGRMSRFISKDKMRIAVSDYAHNRLSFETIILSLRKMYPSYQVISVFGAPGGKAYGRREELGIVGGRYSDYVLITMDDPNDEDVEWISKEIATFVEKERTPYEMISDREAAIQKAFEIADGKTLILAIGKGHETTMKVKGQSVSIKSDDQMMQEMIEQYNQEN